MKWSHFFNFLPANYFIFWTNLLFLAFLSSSTQSASSFNNLSSYLSIHPVCSIFFQNYSHVSFYSEGIHSARSLITLSKSASVHFLSSYYFQNSSQDLLLFYLNEIAFGYFQSKWYLFYFWTASSILSLYFYDICLSLISIFLAFT